MVTNKSLDFALSLVICLLDDIHMSHADVFDSRALKLTCQKVRKRCSNEGIGFLTKSLPRLGKALDRALSSNTPLLAVDSGFEPKVDSVLPQFMWEFFSRVFNSDGFVSRTPCVESVKVLRQIAYMFYKYELPYTTDQEQQVIDQFKRTEDDLLAGQVAIRTLQCCTDCSYQSGECCHQDTTLQKIVREARVLLERVFSDLDLSDIHPRHGPGAVATKQLLWEKYLWTNVSGRIRLAFPLSTYFGASPNAFHYNIDRWKAIDDRDLPARVVLVPKDSRGPRLISEEPVDFQWIQQGIMRAIVDHVERHPLTRDNVRFTDQQYNRRGALIGSSPVIVCRSGDPEKPVRLAPLSEGRYATLDLKEASDRVSLDLVRLLFPEHTFRVLESCRSSATVLPSGEVLKLRKFAPMGSGLCFPIMALTIWALLTASADDADTRECIYVYGDDVIVPVHFAREAMNVLERFGLKLNPDKCCTTGFFRESCGLDAFRGVDVTPVRFRTVWSSSRCPEVYTSWIAYANSMHDRHYMSVYNRIVEALHHTYGEIPEDGQVFNTVPSLRFVAEDKKPQRQRSNPHLQRREYYVWTVKAPCLNRTLDGYSMLLRYFSEAGSQSGVRSNSTEWREQSRPFRVRQYTKRGTSMLVKRWR